MGIFLVKLRAFSWGYWWEQPIGDHDPVHEEERAVEAPSLKDAERRAWEICEAEEHKEDVWRWKWLVDSVTPVEKLI
jgi:hypothetical protein